jgi:hypothetical protein
VTLMFLNSALLSEEGTWLFSADFEQARRPLQLFFEDRVRAVLFSTHSDHGCYLELLTQQTPDFSDKLAADDLRQRMEQLPTGLSGQIAGLPAHPYWSSLQQRFGKMLTELAGSSRVGVERDGVIANCWLAPPALNNLVTATELALASSQFETGTDSVVVTGPQSLAELLELPRDLEVTNSPDLRVLLEDLQAEIRNDFPDLPFEFAIRLQGDELQAQGITQNQRPGKILAKGKPLSEILTQIMFRANPDKDATGPDDIHCKLVWVIGPHPDQPDQQAVLITTRAAAADRGLDLPAAFHPK